MTEELTSGAVRLHVSMKGSLDDPGGLNSVAQSLAKAQSQLGLRSAVLHEIRGPRSYITRDFPLPPDVEELPAEPVVEYHFAQTAHLLRADEKLARTRAVFHFHGPWYSESRQHGESKLRVLAKFAIEARTYRRFPLLTVHSQSFKDELVRTFRVPESRVNVVTPGIDPTVFRPVRKSDARKAVELPADAYVVGSLRRLVPRMGLDVLLRAAAKSPDMVVAIAGTGPELEPLTQLADDLGITSRVFFLGRLPEKLLSAFYSSLDCAVVPSRALEGFGLVVLESMSCGTPVIATEVGGLPEAMGPFAPEWIVPPDSVDELADALNRLRQDPPSCDELLKYAGSKTWIGTARSIEKMLLTSSA